MLSGGRLVQSLSHHQKNITSIAVDGTGSFLLSGSLDHQLKMVGLQDYKVVHSIKYPNPILSLAISPNNSQIAVGMNGGLLCIRKRIIKTDELVKQKQNPRGGSVQYFMRGGNTAPEKVNTFIYIERLCDSRP
jgi:U3 small nucleolar RNA-associated protein 15